MCAKLLFFSAFSNIYNLTENTDMKSKIGSSKLSLKSINAPETHRTPHLVCLFFFPFFPFLIVDHSSLLLYIHYFDRTVT